MQQLEIQKERDLRRQEARVRKLAERNGYRVMKSRAPISIDNFGHFALIEKSINNIVLGVRFDATLDEIADYFLP